eukprot:29761-Eustigmatos_ZCMA.PRE.1
MQYLDAGLGLERLDASHNCSCTHAHPTCLLADCRVVMMMEFGPSVSTALRYTHSNDHDSKTRNLAGRRLEDARGSVT